MWSSKTVPCHKQSDAVDNPWPDLHHSPRPPLLSYQRLLQTISVLEAQRTQAILDLEALARHQRQALANPVAFVDQLQKQVRHHYSSAHTSMDICEGSPSSRASWRSCGSSRSMLVLSFGFTIHPYSCWVAARIEDISQYGRALLRGLKERSISTFKLNWRMRMGAAIMENWPLRILFTSTQDRCIVSGAAGLSP